MLRADLAPRAAKRLQTLPKVERRRILWAITELTTTPFPRGVKSLGSWHGLATFRIRVGSYRVLYTIQAHKDRVLITGIDKRGRIYNR